MTEAPAIVSLPENPDGLGFPDQMAEHPFMPFRVMFSQKNGVADAHFLIKQGKGAEL